MGADDLAYVQTDQITHILELIGKLLPWWQPIETIPDFKIIRGMNFTIDPRDNPIMPEADCQVLTAAQINAKIQAGVYEVGKFEAQPYCRK